MALDDGMTTTQEAAFEIIATVGTAKSMYIGAIQKAKAGDIEGARADILAGTEICSSSQRLITVTLSFHSSCFMLKISLCKLSLFVSLLRTSLTCTRSSLINSCKEKYISLIQQKLIA